MDEHIQYHPVSSSNVHSIGYDEEAKKLYVRYKGSGSLTTYVYHGVEPHVFRDVMGASSVGSYLAKNVKRTFLYDRL